MNLYAFDTSLGGGRTIDIHYLTQDWTEGTGDATESGDGATWNTYNGTDNWGAPGSDYYGTATDSITMKSKNSWYAWTVTGDVQDFADGTTTNYGWIVKDNDETVAQTQAGEHHSRTSGSGLEPYLAVTFTAPWESYTDADHLVLSDNFSDFGDYVYMEGTGFASGDYNVGYYDATVTGGGNLTATDTSISVTGDGILHAQYYLATDQEAAGNNSWHALVQPASGYTAFDSSYDTVIAAPDTYGLLANDSFYVAQSAIPEFPTVVAAITVVGLCFGIYYWMRRRRLVYVEV